VKWENKKDILIQREEKKKKGKGEAPGIAVVIEDKPGLKEWWEACTGEGITTVIVLAKTCQKLTPRRERERQGQRERENLGERKLGLRALIYSNFLSFSDTRPRS
jgi:hypothetical protein